MKSKLELRTQTEEINPYQSPSSDSLISEPEPFLWPAVKNLLIPGAFLYNRHLASKKSPVNFIKKACNYASGLVVEWAKLNAYIAVAEEISRRAV